ncbi:MAG: ABC transporter ATP-binding protein [Methanobacteriota archaeon]
MGVLTCRGLSKWYGDVIAVNDVTVDVKSGITGFLGPNGAGKSSLMRLAMGLLTPSQGEIQVLDEDPWDNNQLLRRIGYVPEGDAPWRDRTGLEGARLAARLSGLSGSEATEAVDKALARVGLTVAAEKRVGTFSLGMRQRYKFALAILHEPELLILDEPLMGTDPLTRRDLIQMIREFARAGRSILVSTHVLPDVESMTQRIMLMHRGRLMAHGEVAEIRDLLDRFPRTVKITTPNPRELGSELWRWETVLSLEAQENAVVVRTKRPREFHADLQALLAKRDHPFGSIVAVDENVEAIFQYLVG